MGELTEGTKQELDSLDGRIVEWISRRLHDAEDEAGNVSALFAERIAVRACNLTIRAMGGL